MQLKQMARATCLVLRGKHGGRESDYMTGDNERGAVFTWSGR